MTRNSTERGSPNRRAIAFTPPVAVASLSGQSDAEWARTAAPHVGGAFLGGIALDRDARNAARKLVERDRDEFLPPDPIAFIERQLAALEEVPVRPGVNVRSATLPAIRDAGETCARYDAILEINAHCRQPEMCAIGCGEELLRNVDRLCEYVSVAAETGAEVSVKVRAEVAGVDLPATARRVAAAGGDMLHVDAMDSESVVGEVADALETQHSSEQRPIVIANNGVRGRETVREYLEYGADAVSVGRPSDRPELLAQVRRATEAWLDERTTAVEK